jgi:hypothetical protein
LSFIKSGKAREASSSAGVCGSFDSSYADLCFFEEEERDSEAGRFVAEPGLREALHAERRALAAFSSEMAVAIVERSDPAIWDILKKLEKKRQGREVEVPPQIGNLESFDAAHGCHHGELISARC